MTSYELSFFNDTLPECPVCPQDDYISWAGVGIAASLILINAFLSLALGLGLFFKLVIAALRCLVQLYVMSLILEPVLNQENVYYIFGYSGILVLLAAFETSFNKGKGRYKGVFFVILLSLFISTSISSFIGTAFAMNAEPFYEPRRFIPTVGMILGNSVSGVAIGINTAIGKFISQSDHIETALSFGATRYEAALPILRESLKAALLPTLNSMTVMGLISIPGMLTGQILSGADPSIAVRYQIIIMYLIAGATALGTVISVIITMCVLIDSKARIRDDRITTEEFFLNYYINRLTNRLGQSINHCADSIRFCWKRKKGYKPLKERSSSNLIS